VEKLSKLSKRKSDISFLDPVTMEVVCTLNQCYKKFTIEKTEVKIYPSGKEWVLAFHECTECGRRVQGIKDRGVAFHEHQARNLKKLRGE